MEGYDVGLDPLVQECLVRGDVDHKLVWEHDRNPNPHVPKRVEDFRVCVVDFHALRFQGGL